MSPQSKWGWSDGLQSKLKFELQPHHCVAQLDLTLNKLVSTPKFKFENELWPYHYIALLVQTLNKSVFTSKFEFEQELTIIMHLSVDITLNKSVLLPRLGLCWSFNLLSCCSNGWTLNKSVFTPKFKPKHELQLCGHVVNLLIIQACKFESLEALLLNEWKHARA